MRSLIVLLLVVLGTTAMAQETDYQITTSEWPAKSYLGHRATMPEAEIGNYFAQHLPAAFQTIVSAGLSPETPPSGLYWSFDESARTAVLTAGVGFSGEINTLPEGFEIVELPETIAISIDYYGPYGQTEAAYDAAEAYMTVHELGDALVVVEEYITDPTTEPDPANWLTRIHHLVVR